LALQIRIKSPHYSFGKERALPERALTTSSGWINSMKMEQLKRSAK
jgi:hypothetical protein